MSFDLSSGDVVGAVASMDTPDFVGIAVFLGVFTLIAFLTAFHSLRRARLIEDLPTSKIRSAHQGYVELEGYAMPYEERGMQVSPLEGRDCVWWKYKVQERRSSGRGKTRWVTIDKGRSLTPFVVEDDTGRCVVRPEGANARVNLSRTWYGATPRPAHGAAGGSLMGRYRYKERVILAGERLYALGRFATRHEQPSGTMTHELTKPDDGSTFLLATQSQHRLTASLRNGASSAFTAFLAGGAGLMWLLAARGIF
jgi:hypothetical protein